MLAFAVESLLNVVGVGARFANMEGGGEAWFVHRNQTVMDCCGTLGDIEGSVVATCSVLRVWS